MVGPKKNKNTRRFKSFPKMRCGRRSRKFVLDPNIGSLYVRFESESMVSRIQGLKRPAVNPVPLKSFLNCVRSSPQIAVGGE